MQITVSVTGLSELMRRAQAMGQRGYLTPYLRQAGHEAMTLHVLPVRGVQAYPPATDANQPPTPYYERGLGMWVGGKRVPMRNLGNSQRLGSQFGADLNGNTSWYLEQDDMTTTLGNRTTYAPYVVGADQAAAMAAIGWRQLTEVAEEQRANIIDTYQRWIRQALDDLGF
jgi:hypothetical protein